ncbi:hypothetical protein Scep_019476 [Stephania cephalantha]|uniref:Uncharacterized protein n=1 Tax=Stephania cephalantha TaxID=152367 RepID=A0AAP0IB42_9MAGN
MRDSTVSDIFADSVRFSSLPPVRHVSLTHHTTTSSAAVSTNQKTPHLGVTQVEVCEICGDYSHSAHNCPYYPQYENYHDSSYASPQPDFFGLMSNPQIDFEIPSLKDLETQFIQYNARLQNMTYEEELCSTQPIFNPDEDVSVDTNEVTQVEDYWKKTSEECEVFRIEPEIFIALNEGENEMKIDVISDKPEKPQIESEED